MQWKSNFGVALVALAVVLTVQATTPAFGAFTFNIQQIPQAVLVTGSGTLNTSALTFNHSGVTTGADIDGSFGIIDAGPVSNASTVPFSEYKGIAGPALFGSGSLFSASSGSGDGVGIAIGMNLAVPVNYVSDTSLSDSALFNFATFTSLGLIPGSYLYTWGSGPTADSLTINIGVVPEPASLAMIALPLGVAQLRRRGRRLS